MSVSTNLLKVQSYINGYTLSIDHKTTLRFTGQNINNINDSIISTSQLMLFSDMVKALNRFDKSNLSYLINLPENINIDAWFLYQHYFIDKTIDIKNIISTYSLEVCIEILVELVFYLKLNTNCNLVGSTHPPLLYSPPLPLPLHLKLLKLYFLDDFSKIEVPIEKKLMELHIRCRASPMVRDRLHLHILKQAKYYNLVSPNKHLYYLWGKIKSNERDDISNKINIKHGSKFMKRLQKFVHLGTSTIVENKSADPFKLLQSIFKLNQKSEMSNQEDSMIILAGGALLTLTSDRNLDDVADSEDLDLWLLGGTSSNRYKLLLKFVELIRNYVDENFGSHEFIFITYKNQAFTFIIPGVRQLQLIITGCEDPCEIPGSFDMDCIKGYYDGYGIYLSGMMAIALEKKMISIDLDSIRAKRCLKLLRYNFQFLPNNIEFMPIGTIFEEEKFICDKLWNCLENICDSSMQQTERTSFTSEHDWYPMSRVILSDLRTPLKNMRNTLNNDSKNLHRIISESLNILSDRIGTNSPMNVENLNQVQVLGKQYLEETLWINDLYISKENEKVMSDICNIILSMPMKYVVKGHQRAFKMRSRILCSVKNIPFTLRLELNEVFSWYKAPYVVLDIIDEHLDTSWLRQLDATLMKKIVIMYGIKVSRI